MCAVQTAQQAHVWYEVVLAGTWMTSHHAGKGKGGWEPFLEQAEVKL